MMILYRPLFWLAGGGAVFAMVRNYFIGDSGKNPLPADQRRFVMKMSSPAFNADQEIDKKYTCQGLDVNPPFQLQDIPQAAKSLAIVCEDLDTPMGVWSHWVAYDLPAAGTIAEDTPEGKHGINDYGFRQYNGPCPESRTHRYLFKLYALDTILHLKEGVNKISLRNAMKGHILAESEFIGFYQREAQA